MEDLIKSVQETRMKKDTENRENVKIEKTIKSQVGGSDAGTRTGKKIL